MTFLLKLLCFCLTLPLLAKKPGQETQNLLKEANIAIQAQNYDLAKEVYLKIPARGLRLTKLQELYKTQGNLPMSLLMAYKRFHTAGFAKRLNILQDIYQLRVLLGIGKKKYNLPKVLYKYPLMTKHFDKAIDHWIFFKECVTNLALELLILLLWILLICSLLLLANKLVSLSLILMFLACTGELYQRLVNTPTNKLSIVVLKNAKLLSKPDLSDATTLETLIAGERVKIIEQKQGFARIARIEPMATIDQRSDSGWVDENSLLKISDN